MTIWGGDMRFFCKSKGCKKVVAFGDSWGGKCKKCHFGANRYYEQKNHAKKVKAAARNYQSTRTTTSSRPVDTKLEQAIRIQEARNETVRVADLNRTIAQTTNDQAFKQKLHQQVRAAEVQLPKAEQQINERFERERQEAARKARIRVNLRERCFNLLKKME